MTLYQVLNKAVTLQSVPLAVTPPVLPLDQNKLYTCSPQPACVLLNMFSCSAVGTMTAAQPALYVPSLMRLTRFTPCILVITQKTQETALHYSRDVRITIALLRAGADKRKRNHDGLTPLFVALRDGLTDVARVLAGTFGYLKFHPMTLCAVYALKGLACCASPSRAR